MSKNCRNALYSETVSRRQNEGTSREKDKERERDRET